jgi:hypothetical protein
MTGVVFDACLRKMQIGLAPLASKLGGREEIQSVLAREHSTWAKTASMSITATAVRKIGQDDAVLHFNWKISGAVGSNGKQIGPSHGANLPVITRTPTEWQIVAGQVARAAGSGHFTRR